MHSYRQVQTFSLDAGAPNPPPALETPACTRTNGASGYEPEMALVDAVPTPMEVDAPAPPSTFNGTGLGRRGVIALIVVYISQLAGLQRVTTLFQKHLLSACMNVTALHS